MKEKKKELEINLSTLLLLVLIIIICIGVLILKFYNSTTHETEKFSESNTKISEKEEIKVNSDYGKAISSYIEQIWIDSELYGTSIAEFKDIKLASKDYLAVCASLRTMYKNEDVYNTKSKLSDFNTSLIELFGNEADGLITTSDIEKVFFVEKISDDTYHFLGFDGSEISGNNYIITKIEKQNNTFSITQYEYKYKYDDIPLNLEDGQLTYRHIYDMEDNLILTTTVKVIEKDNTKSYKEYDKNGNEIEDIQQLLLTKYSNKLSVRHINLEYNSFNNAFIMISNELEK